MKVAWKPIIVPSYNGGPSVYNMEELNGDPSTLYRVASMPSGKQVSLAQAEILYQEQIGFLMFETEEKAELRRILKLGLISWCVEQSLQIVLDGSEYQAAA